MTTTRRRLSVDDRRNEFLHAALELIGTQPWDEISMADVARAAGASKPLLYHYFSTKSDLYLAAVTSAAAELSAATRPDPDLPGPEQLVRSLTTHLDWIEANDFAYRAILQGGLSSDRYVQAIVETARAEVVDRLADAFDLGTPDPAQRIALRGWVGFLEGACLDWLLHRDISKDHLVRLLEASVGGALRAGRTSRKGPRGD